MNDNLKVTTNKRSMSRHSSIIVNLQAWLRKCGYMADTHTFFFYFAVYLMCYALDAGVAVQRLPTNIEI